MGLTQLNFAGLNKVEVAVERIKQYEPDDGYFLCFSGGKDSIVIYDLVKRAGVNYSANYSQTGIDPPELVVFIRKHYPNVVWHKPRLTMWQGIKQNGLPRQRYRWCCRVLKEPAGRHAVKLDGVRWQESAMRRKRQIFDHRAGGYLHPIIDWTSDEVWEYIREENLPYCCLYTEGFSRIGCILCPFVTGLQLKLQIERYPKFVEAYRRAAIRSWDRHTVGMERWASGVEYFEWWLARGEQWVGSEDAMALMFA